MALCIDCYSPGLNDVGDNCYVACSNIYDEHDKSTMFRFDCKDGMRLSILIGEICYLEFQFN